MKRLFCVKNQNQRRVSGFFDNKPEAKTARDSKQKHEGKKGVYYHVGLGPDHMGPHGMGKVPVMRRQPKK